MRRPKDHGNAALRTGHRCPADPRQAGQPRGFIVSAVILPFRPRPVAGSFRVTREERAQAAAWAAARSATAGGGWWIEAIPTGQGALVLGVVTPSSPSAPDGQPDYAWCITRTGEGLAVIEPELAVAVGLFATMAAALAALDGAETLAARLRDDRPTRASRGRRVQWPGHSLPVERPWPTQRPGLHQT